MMLAAPAQSTRVDEITRHEGASMNCSSPDVVVSSVYVPSALAVRVPVTRKDPVTAADGQPALASVKSSSPVTFRHDDETVQVPATVPAQGVTLGQAGPGSPPLPFDPLLLPPEPPPLPPDPPLHPSRAIAAARATAHMSPRSPLRMRGSVGSGRFLSRKMPADQRFVARANPQSAIRSDPSGPYAGSRMSSRTNPRSAMKVTTSATVGAPASTSRIPTSRIT